MAADRVRRLVLANEDQLLIHRTYFTAMRKNLLTVFLLRQAAPRPQTKVDLVEMWHLVVTSSWHASLIAREGSLHFSITPETPLSALSYTTPVRR